MPGRAASVNVAIFAMLAASFMSMFDRSTLPPMLTAMSADLDASLGEVGAALSVYSICYAISQLAWSAVSSRLGQVRVLRMALVAAAAFTILTACAFDPVVLWIARALSGLAIGAIVPATLVYVGDNVPLARRAHSLANLATATSLGATVAVVVASVFGPLGAWRWVFVGTAVVELVIVVLLWRVNAGPRPASPVPIRTSMRRVLGDAWAVLILGLVFLEGATLYGVMGFLPAALHNEGTDAMLAGVVTGIYGVTLIGTAQLMKLILGRIRPAVLLLVGGAANALGFALLVATISVPSVLVASGLFGFAWAIAHTQMQNWMTDAVAKDRPVGMALFSTALFVGAAAGAAVGSAAASNGAYVWLFAGTSLAGAVFAVGATLGRRVYRVRSS